MRKRAPEPAPTIWEVPDDCWALIDGILKVHYPRKEMDLRRVDLRGVLNGVIFRMRTGCQWNKLPGCFGDDSSIHRHFQKWCELGVFERIWAVLVESCTELGGVNWKWQAVDGAMGKARFGGTSSGRIPRIARRTA